MEDVVGRAGINGTPLVPIVLCRNSVDVELWASPCFVRPHTVKIRQDDSACSILKSSEEAVGENYENMKRKSFIFGVRILLHTCANLGTLRPRCGNDRRNQGHQHARPRVGGKVWPQCQLIDNCGLSGSRSEGGFPLISGTRCRRSPQRCCSLLFMVRNRCVLPSADSQILKVFVCSFTALRACSKLLLLT